MIGTAERSKRYAKGLEFYDQGLLIDALAEFEAVLKSAQPDSPEGKLAAFYTGQVHARLAEESIQRGAREHAEQHLRKAISGNPKFPDLHYQLAQIIAESGAIREAMTELEIALKLNPEYCQSHTSAGDSLISDRRVYGRRALHHPRRRDRAALRHPDLP